eukprot:1161636-Pelagomonas_calceolata.AAC.5
MLQEQGATRNASVWLTKAAYPQHNYIALLQQLQVFEATYMLRALDLHLNHMHTTREWVLKPARSLFNLGRSRMKQWPLLGLWQALVSTLG